MISLTRYILSTLLLLTPVVIQAQTQQQTKVLKMQYKSLRDTSGDHLVISCNANFPTQAIVFTGVAKSANGTTTLTVPPASTTSITEGAKVIGAASTLSLAIGEGKPLTSDMLSLTVSASSQPIVETPQPGDPITSEMIIDMQFVNDYVAKVAEVTRLGALAQTCSTEVPTIGYSNVTPLDTSISLKVSSNHAVKVKAEARLKGTANRDGAPSDEIEIPSFGSGSVRVTRLAPNTPYEIHILETSQHPGRANALDITVLTDSAPTPAPLKTIVALKTPSVSFQSGPGSEMKVIQNQRIDIPPTISNAPRIRLTLQTSNALGVFEDAEPPAVFPGKPTPDTSETLTAQFKLKQTTLSPSTLYRLKVEGLTQYDEIPAGPAILTDTFHGLPALVANGVNMEFTKDGITFSADTNHIPAQVEVRVGDTSQPFLYAHSEKNGNPSFALTFEDLKKGLSAVTPAAGAAPAAASATQIPLQ